VTTTQTLTEPADPDPGTPDPQREQPPDPRRERPAGGASEPGGSPFEGLPQLTRLLGTIVAPTTLLTALLFYFGWSHAYWYYDYFGVNATLLGLTTRDYVQKSLDGLFVPMLVVACVGLLLLWGHALVRARLGAGARPGVLRVLVPAVAATGLVLVAAALVSVFVATPLSRRLVGTPLTLAAGVLLLVYAVHLWRLTGGGSAPRASWVAVAEWAAVFVLVGLSLFWAASDYSASVGISRARRTVARLPTYPSVVLYSERSLSLRAPGVRETRCRDPEAAYRYRYEGLTLALQSGDQYLFLPRRWTAADGVALLIPRSDALRLEFLRPGARASPIC
jgi:hypothetical protein